MQRNTDYQQTPPHGEALVLDVTDYISRTETLFKEAGVDPFKVNRKAREAVVEFASSCKDAQQESTYTLAKGLSRNRKDFIEWLVLGSELDKTIRDSLSDTLPKGATVTELKLVFDKPHLLISYTEVSENHEIGFEEYIERCRGDGETIHPELDRQLRYFRSIGTCKVHVPYRRRFRTSTF